MARKIQQGMQYFNLDVDFLQNIKVRRILRSCGPQAIIVLIWLLSSIYRDDGYYVRWHEDMPFLIADDVGISEGAAEEIVKKAIQVGFFSAEMYEAYNILTSRGLQQRFFEMARRRATVNYDERYLLVDINEYSNAINVNGNSVAKVDNNVVNANGNSIINVDIMSQDVDKNGINVYRNPINVYKNPIEVDIVQHDVYKNQQSKVKESKVKESKVKESKVKESSSKRKDKQTRQTDPREESMSTTAAAAASELQGIVNLYANNIHPVASIIERDKLVDLVATHGAKYVKLAIEEAVTHNARNLAYIAAVLTNWQTNGYDISRRSDNKKTDADNKKSEALKAFLERRKEHESKQKGVTHHADRRVNKLHSSRTEGVVSDAETGRQGIKHVLDDV